MFGQLSEVCLVKPPWPLQLLPPGDGLRENGVHYAFASKVHAWGWELSFTNPVSPWERISWARQGWDQVHLGYRRRLRKAFRPETDRYVRIEDHITSKKMLKFLWIKKGKNYLAVRLLVFLFLETPAFSTSTSSSSWENRQKTLLLPPLKPLWGLGFNYRRRQNCWYLPVKERKTTQRLPT